MLVLKRRAKAYNTRLYLDNVFVIFDLLFPTI